MELTPQAVGGAELDKESRDREAVQDIGRRVLRKYPNELMLKEYGQEFTTRDAKQVGELKQFYKDYGGHDPVKPDQWLVEIGMKLAGRGNPGNRKKSFFPVL